MRWGGCGLAWMSLYISVWLCSMRKILIRGSVGEAGSSECLLRGRTGVVYGAMWKCIMFLCICYPRALKLHRMEVTFTEPSGTTAVVLKERKNVLRRNWIRSFTGLLLLWQSHISTAENNATMISPVDSPLACLRPGRGISGRRHVLSEPEFAQ